jgi:hypothetical protein
LRVLAFFTFNLPPAVDDIYIILYHSLIAGLSGRSSPKRVLDAIFFIDIHLFGDHLGLLGLYVV